MKKAAKPWYLEKFNMLQQINKNDMIHLERSMVMRTVSKNTLIHFPDREGRFVYLLEEGVIKIVHTGEDGKEFIKHLLKPGSLFGELSILESAEDTGDYAVALEESLICFMDAGMMQGMMQQNPQWDTYIRKLVGLRIKKVENRLVSMIFKNSRQRISDFMLEVAREFGQPVAGRYRVKNMLTHEDIARLTATTRQTTTLILNKLRASGDLEYDTRLLFVRDAAGGAGLPT
jgi:CRP/FNR family transcriptional regulator